MRLYEILNACYQTLISPLSSLQNTYTRAIALVTGPKILRSPASNAPLESRFNLTASTSSTYTLPDGRTLGYATYGAPIGRPILYLRKSSKKSHRESRTACSGTRFEAFHHV